MMYLFAIMTVFKSFLIEAQDFKHKENLDRKWKILLLLFDIAKNEIFFRSRLFSITACPREIDPHQPNISILPYLSR